MRDIADLEEAIALEEAIDEEPAVAFDEAIARLQGVLTDYRGDGELMAYMRHVRRGAIEAMVALTSVDPDDKTKVIALQARIGDYLRLCRYIADVMGYARAGQLANVINDGEGFLNGEVTQGKRGRKPKDGGGIRSRRGSA